MLRLTLHKPSAHFPPRRSEHGTFCPLGIRIFRKKAAVRDITPLKSEIKVYSILPRLTDLVCHPHPLYGGTTRIKVVYRIARSQGTHAHLTGEIEDARAALSWLRTRYADLPFALAGFSFGAQAIARLGCSLENPRFLLAAGFPAGLGDSDYLEACPAPKVFIQSTHDQYGPRDAMEALFGRISGPKRLIWVESGDHFFSGGLEELEERVRAAAAEFDGLTASGA